MNSIGGYELVSAKTAKNLSKLVNERISEAWKPLGAPFYSEGCFFQALLLDRPTEKRLRKTTEE